MRAEILKVDSIFFSTINLNNAGCELYWHEFCQIRTHGNECLNLSIDKGEKTYFINI